MPNWRKDERKSRPSEGRCAFQRCPKASVINYYGFGLCEIHEDYYLDEDMPTPILKKILGIPVSAADHEAAVAERRKFERERRKAVKQAKEEEDEEEFEGALFKTLNRRAKRAKKEDLGSDDGWVPPC